MKTCATCKHMGPRSVFSASEHRVCNRIDGDVRSKEIVGIDVSSDYGQVATAKLVVLPTFGCVLHEEK